MAEISRAWDSGKPNQDGVKIPITQSTLKHGTWKKLLDGYFDLDGSVAAIKYSWDLGLDENPAPRDAHRNHPSALDFPDSVAEYFTKELAHGSIIGPLDPATVPFPMYRAPLATVKKPPNLRRVITDCSSNGRGINAWMSKHLYRSCDTSGLSYNGRETSRLFYNSWETSRTFYSSWETSRPF